MQIIIDIMAYYSSIVGQVFELINNEWLISTIFGLHILYLVIIAVKLKRNTD